MVRAGRKADLVVDDEVDGPGRAMTVDAGQPEALRHNALAGEGSVAMDQQRQDVQAIVAAAALILLGADLAEDNGIDDFQMRGVGGQRQVDIVAVKRRGPRKRRGDI